MNSHFTSTKNNSVVVTYEVEVPKVEYRMAEVKWEFMPRKD